MQTSDPTYNSLSPGTLNITQSDVLEIINRIYEVEGLAAAREAFKQLNSYFSCIKGWSETTIVIQKFLAEKRKEEQEQTRKYKLEEQRAAAPQIHVVSLSSSDASNNSSNIDQADIDKMDVGIYSPGNNIAKTIILDNLDKDDEN